MEFNALMEKVREIVCEVLGNFNIGYDTVLRDEVDMVSLKLIGIIIRLEDEYDIFSDDYEPEIFHSVRTISEFVWNLIEKG